MHRDSLAGVPAITDPAVGFAIPVIIIILVCAFLIITKVGRD